MLPEESVQRGAPRSAARRAIQWPGHSPGGEQTLNQKLAMFYSYYEDEEELTSRINGSTIDGGR